MAPGYPLASCCGGAAAGASGRVPSLADGGLGSMGLPSGVAAGGTLVPAGDAAAWCCWEGWVWVWGGSECDRPTTAAAAAACDAGGGGGGGGGGGILPGPEGGTAAEAPGPPACQRHHRNKRTRNTCAHVSQDRSVQPHTHACRRIRPEVIRLSVTLVSGAMRVWCVVPLLAGGGGIQCSC